MLNMAVLLPTPIANARIATALNPGSREKPRRLCRRSRRKPRMRADYIGLSRRRAAVPPDSACPNISWRCPESHVFDFRLRVVIEPLFVLAHGPTADRPDPLA